MSLCGKGRWRLTSLRRPTSLLYDPPSTERMGWGRLRNWGARLRAKAALCGWPAVVRENESVRVTVLVGEGAEGVEFLHKPTDAECCHFTRRGMRRPEQVAARLFLDQ